MEIRGDVHPEGVIDLDLEKDPDGPQTINCIDCSPHEAFFVGADSENDIWEIDDEPRNMVEGQSGAVMGLCPHPVLSRVYATTCTDGQYSSTNDATACTPHSVTCPMGEGASQTADTCVECENGQYSSAQQYI